MSRVRPRKRAVTIYPLPLAKIATLSLKKALKVTRYGLRAEIRDGCVVIKCRTVIMPGVVMEQKIDEISLNPSG